MQELASSIIHKEHRTPVMLTIAASDSCGGAGIQADIKTATSLGVYAASALTAVTVQDTLHVYDVVPLAPETIYRQIKVVCDDINPQAIKIGLIPDRACAEAVASAITDTNCHNIVLDPVAVASTGDNLARKGDFNLEVLASTLFHLCDLITPNYPEMRGLLGHDFKNPHAACREFLERFGADAVCLKGGHSKDTDVTDLFISSTGDEIEITKPRINAFGSHGTGCTFSSAAASFLALGFSLSASVRLASRFTSSLIEAGRNNSIGHGSGCMSFHINHFNISDHI